MKTITLSGGGEEAEGSAGERSPKEAQRKGLTGGGSFKGGGLEVLEEGPKVSAGPRPEGGEIPPEVLDAYLEGGLFAVEPQWRALVQRVVQRRQLEHIQDKLQGVDSKGNGKGKKEGGVWSTLSKSFSFGSKGSKPGPPLRMGSGDEGSNKKWGKKVLVEQANKQYELLYEVAEWEAAREATARVTAVDASGHFQKEYAPDEQIEAEYKRRFGPPKSRFIGSKDKLMVC